LDRSGRGHSPRWRFSHRSSSRLMNPAPPLESDLRPELFAPVWFDCRWPGRLNAQYMPLTMRPNPTTPRAIHHAEFDTSEIARIVAASPAPWLRPGSRRYCARNEGLHCAAASRVDPTAAVRDRRVASRTPVSLLRSLTQS